VLNPPYLLFYPDADGDDVPDGDPEVHLEGFGIEDTHSIANNLRWGPDGWLYAVQGSTVTGKICRPGEKTVVTSQGQLVWRYHPELRRYEVFAEGGGNAFGLEIDGQGRLFSGHNGGNTRGFHYVQGGYYQKTFGKHGDLSNPFAFGYFEAMRHHQVPRFTHAFLIYEGGALPPGYTGLLFGVAPLQGHVVLSRREQDGSTFRTRDVGYALTSTDTWFRPVEIQSGPDGAVYVADFYEQRIDHASHYQGRVDRASGRIYRLRAQGRRGGVQPFDLRKESTAALLDRLTDSNKWFRQAARRELLLRRDPQTARLARQRLAQASGQAALEYLWAAHVAQPLTEEETEALLARPEAEVRAWAVRLACDDGAVGTALAQRLADLAYREPQVQVRSQLASSARRLPASEALPVLAALARRSEDVDDPHLPLLIWWALEAKADRDRQAVLALFREAALWDQPLVEKHLLERLMRRYASTGLRKDLVTAGQLLALAPTPQHAQRLLAGLEAAYEGRSMVDLPPELAAAMAKVGGGSLLLRLRQGDPQAVAEALKTIADERADPARRSRWIAAVASLHPPEALQVLLDVAVRSRNEALQSAALSALSAYDDPRIPQIVLRLHGELPESVREVAQSLLASRLPWARELLAAVERGQIAKESLIEGTVRRLVLYDDPQMLAMCRQHWPALLQEASPQEVQKELARLVELLSAGNGNPYQGKVLYQQMCGKCHTLFGQGGQIGPDLTVYKRDDLTGLLLSILQPSAEIREGYENYVVRTADGRLLSGLLVDQDAQVVVLRTADGQSHALPRDEIEDLRASRTSLMPAGQLQPLSDQQIRDLLAYLRSPQPLPGSE
jgi:putative membrane-bound dehydrogenase-like protein